LLNIIGFFFSPPGGELWKVLLNRALSIFVIWLTTLLCLWQYRTEKNLLQIHDQLDKNVKDRTDVLNQTNVLLRRERSFLQLLKNIAVTANESNPFETTMKFCLEQICAHSNWPVGHLYLVKDRSSMTIVPTTIWYLENPQQFETFKKITESSPFDIGIGLPGRVLESGQPAWISDVTQDENFPRTQFGKNIGVKAGFAFPIMIGREVTGVMEFFSSKIAEPDQEMLETMAQVGTLLGRIIERVRAEEDQGELLSSLQERVKELTSLYGVASLVQTSKSMAEVFQNLESQIIPGMQYPELTQVKVIFEDQVYVSKNFNDSADKLSCDITINDERRGSLEISYSKVQPSSDEGPFLKEERDMIEGCTRLLSLAAERKKAEEDIKTSREQLRNLYHRLEKVREEERTRIAREVHDELAQVLTALKLEMSILDQNLPGNNPGLKKKAHMMIDLIDNSIQTGKKIAAELRPPILDDLGLPEAISWQCRDFESRTKIRCLFDMRGFRAHPDINRATTLFRIFQETLTNIIRHAKATNVCVRLSEKHDAFVLTVEDNGIGITVSEASNSRSLGILGMRERAQVWGGQLNIQGYPKKGTTVTITILKEGK
jgi:signal transduction histidine kinase